MSIKGLPSTSAPSLPTVSSTSSVSSTAPTTTAEATTAPPADSFDAKPSTTRSQDNLPPVPVRNDLMAEVKRRQYAAKGGSDLAPTKLTKSVGTDGAITIKGTNANDKIVVTPRDGGGVCVTAGKNKIELSDEEAKKLTIDAGKGNDMILVDPGVKYDVTLKGGDGDDLIRGGSGKNTIYGGAGRDILYGGDGGNTISGGSGDDVIYGGKGDDTITGNDGKNTIVGGAGKNTYANGGGTDRVFGNKDDKYGKLKGASAGKTTKVELGAAGSKPAGSSIKIEGSPEFKAKVERELEALRSTKTGRALLEDIDSHPDKPVKITEGKDESIPDNEADAMQKGLKLSPKGKPSITGTGKGSGSTVTFDPDNYRVRDGAADNTEATDADDPFEMPPAVALFHELNHSYRAQVGQSDGLTMKEEYDTAGTIDQTDPDETRRFGGKYTENQLRAEMGLPDRRRYEDD